MVPHEKPRDVQTDAFVSSTHLEFGEIAPGDYHAVFGRMFPGLRTLVSLAFLLFLFSLVIAQAQVSGVVRYILVALAITFLGGAVAWLASRSARDPTPMEWTSRIGEASPGDLRRVARSLERGQQGMAFSQLQFVDRLRAAFLRKLGAKRNLTEWEVGRLLEDPSRLRDVVRDPEIERFLLEAEQARRRWSRIVVTREPVLPSLIEEGGFLPRMQQVVKRMEAWQ